MVNADDGIGDAVWQGEALAAAYLDGVRGAIPLAADQMDILVRLAQAARPAARTILDLGCGDGLLGYALQNAYTTDEGRQTTDDSQPLALVLADFSEPMLEAARGRFGKSAYGVVHFLHVDYANPEWPTLVSAAPCPAHYDIIVSGFSIHHQPDDIKRRIYEDIYRLLTPGGIFLNLEHVASATRWGEAQFEAYFIDALHRYHAPFGKTRNEVATDFYHRPDKSANQLSPVEAQCQWLRDIGFAEVDCFFKVFELAIFGGIRPESSAQSR